MQFESCQSSQADDCDTKVALWIVVIVMNLLIPWQVVSFVSTAWATTGDISSDRLRAKTQGVASIGNAFSTWLFTFTVAYIYNVDAENLGICAGFIYGGGSLLFLATSYLLVLDLRGFAIEEVDWMYENKIPIPKFTEYSKGKAKEDVAAVEAHMAGEKSEVV